MRRRKSWCSFEAAREIQQFSVGLYAAKMNLVSDEGEKLPAISDRIDFSTRFACDSIWDCLLITVSPYTIRLVNSSQGRVRRRTLPPQSTCRASARCLLVLTAFRKAVTVV
jgi:hypothetical protein